MRVLHVASEVAPFAQSGGLADVVAGLPAAQASLGVETAVVVPLYGGVADRFAAAGIAIEPGAPLVLELGAHHIPAAIRIAQVGAVRYGLVDCPALYDRPGALYGPSPSEEFGDNHLRFAALGKAAVVAGDLVLGGPPHVLHAHDWQAGPAAIYARLAARLPAAHLAGRSGDPAPRIITTIHNLAFRGIFPKHVVPELGIPWSMFTPEIAEFYDQISFLKAGLALADAVTTVSPTYAHEILTPALGEALDGFLRSNLRRLVGIANGIDTVSWDPASDPQLPATYSRDQLAGKAACRAALASELGLPLDDGDLVISVIARMTGQKGLDLIADVVPELARLGMRLVVLGSGEPALESRFRWLAEVFRQHVAVRIGFDAGLARRIYAGSDLFAMPSRFEPCGLGQLYAMRYGAIPVVHAVGGLRDTVLDPGDRGLVQGRGTGLAFTPATPAALLGALERAAALFRDGAVLATVRAAAMARDSSWQASAREYLTLYRSVLA